MKVIDFYWDPVSPYAWLASTQIAAFRKRHGARIRYRPVLLAGLLDVHGNVGPAEIPAKRTYVARDVMRWARRHGLAFQGPPAHPFNPLKALRMAFCVPDDDEREHFANALLAAAWADGRDITEDETLVAVANHVGLDGRELLAEAGEAVNKQGLRRQTDVAAAMGIFGVPTFVVDGELFWGNDRLEFLSAHLMGQIPIDREAFDRFLARPATASRTPREGHG